MSEFSYDDLAFAGSVGSSSPFYCLLCARVFRLTTTHNRGREGEGRGSSEHTQAGRTASSSDEPTRTSEGRETRALCPSCTSPLHPITEVQATSLERAIGDITRGPASELTGSEPIDNSGRPGGASTLDGMAPLLQVLTSLFGGATAGDGASFGAGALDMDGLDAMILQSLQAGASSTSPAAPDAIAALRRVQVKDVNKDLPQRHTLRISVAEGENTAEIMAVLPGLNEYYVVPASFSADLPLEPQAAKAKLKMSEPIDGNGPGGSFINAGDVRGCAVLFTRGGITFASKALRAARAGAAAVVICQHEAAKKEWPLIMVDGTGEVAAATAASKLSIPVVLLSFEDGRRLQSVLTKGADLDARLYNMSTSPCCPVCMEDFQVESNVVFMPCQHGFHEDCLAPWLKTRNTCPMCRHELPVDETAAPDAAAGARSRRLVAERDAIADSWYA